MVRFTNINGCLTSRGLHMKSYKPYLAIAIVLFIAFVFVFYRGSSSEVTPSGLHGGRMLVDRDIAVEITIYEHGMPPRFRVYLYQNKKPVDPRSVNLVMTLKRFNGQIDTVHFEPIDDYLQSIQEISEPHSFDVTVSLKIFNKDLTWNYEILEGRITLSPEVIKSANIKIGVARSASIEKKLSVIGKISPNKNALSSIYPRFAGIVKQMKKSLGESVTKNEVIAVVESNESLREYSIISPIAGTIVQKYVIIGEMIKEDKAIYQVADLSTVWADLTLYRKEAPLIKKGMPVVVSGDYGKPIGAGVIDYISPLGIEDSQTILARSVLTNKNHEWIPGMYVNATITYLSKNVPVAIELSALQRWRDKDIVFVQQGNNFEATPITLGEKNDQQVEVTSGLKSGQFYVVENSFLLKAELGKSEASHEH